jgi:hypothetical protein
VPAGAVKARFYIRRQVPSNGQGSQGTLYVWNLFCYRKANSELIVDGSITADKIAVNAVKAANIDVTNLGALNIKVTNADITNLTISGEKIQAGGISDAYYNTSGGTIPKSDVTNVVSRVITVLPDERLFVTAFWNLNLSTSLSSELMYIGNASLRVGSTVLDTIKIVGQAVDGLAAMSQTISGSYVNNTGNSMTVTITLRMDIKSGGSLRTNDADRGLISGSNVNNDGTSMNIVRLKK